LLVEVVDDDSDEEVEGEEGAEDDEEDEVEVHVDVHLTDRLLTNLDDDNHILIGILGVFIIALNCWDIFID